MLPFPFPFTSSPSRIRPEADDVSRSIIAAAPATKPPHVAPGIPGSTAPGPLLGVRTTTGNRHEVAALHRATRHVVLVLTSRRTSLYEGDGDRLIPVTGSRFPVSPTASLAEVDGVLGDYLAKHPAVVVVAGPQSLVTAFREASADEGAVVGTVYGGFDVVDVVDLARRVRPVLRRYVDSREQAALFLLHESASAGRVASGLEAARDGARAEQPELLVLEEPLAVDGGDAPALDELIRVVLERGGSVTLAPEGSLAQHGRVALALA